MEKNKSLRVRKENVFNKIFNFIKKLFYKNKEKVPSCIDSSSTSNSQEDQNSNSNNVLETSPLKGDSKNNFIENIRVIHSESSELLDLQQKYENNEISLYNLSKEQLNELNILYQRQIVKLKKQIDDTQTEIKIVQYGLKNKNAHT